MRVSLPGLFKNIVRDLPRNVSGQYEAALEELEKHIRETIRGEHTLDDFARFYCLDDRSPLTKQKAE